MLELTIRIAKHCAINCLQLPLALWIEMRWVNLRFRESQHLLRLDDYLLRDMGLRKVSGRIEAIDPARLDRDRGPGSGGGETTCRANRARHAN